MNYIHRKIDNFIKRYGIWAYVSIGILFVLLIISRRPDAITKPGFWAEDGVFWFSEAYKATNPLEPFFVPKQGYFQTVSRVGAFIAQYFDILFAPFVFNAVAICIQVLPALFFLSKRFEYLVPKIGNRILLGLLYIGLLGTAETHANLTNAQWRLAILMYLIIIAASSRRMLWKVFDGAMLTLAGLSGPFVFFAFPLAVLYAIVSKTLQERALRLAILFGTFSIQLYSFLFIVSDATRSKEELGATIINFFKIVSGNVFVGAIVGVSYTRKIMGVTLWKNGFLPVMIGIIFFAMLGYVFVKAKNEIRLLILFAFAIFAAGMLSPQVSLVKPQWDIMAGGSGGRYYLLPRLAWIISLVWLVSYAKNSVLRKGVLVLMCIYVVVGIPKDWVFAKYKDYHYAAQVQDFKKLDVGQSYTFKINPKWEMVLTKK